MTYDVICIGAGPTGLACAIEAKRLGMKPLVLDKGCLCNSLLHYPVNMVFFTTAEKMEIGDLPMSVTTDKPTRVEALKYYRKCAEFYGLEVRQYEAVEDISRIAGDAGGHFRIRTRRTDGPGKIVDEHRATRLVIATGYYDIPKLLGIPGEDLPHVSHYFTEVHPFWKRDVAIIGAGNSAAEAALELFRAGARVTLVHRGSQMKRTVKYWVLPDIENRIEAGEVKAHFNSTVARIEPGRLVLHEARAGNETVLPADQVFALTGYRPDFAFLKRAGIELDPQTNRPNINPETLETNVPNLYVAGVLIGGNNTSEIFIENGRFHGKQIAASFK
jgi:thioredoxin reductase (NADPH)